MYQNISIVADKLSKKFNTTQVFKNISFQIKKGNVLGVKGRNGAGKSTLLNIVAGLESLTSGVLNIFLDDNKVQNYNKILGVVSPLIFFYEDLTVFENLHFISFLFLPHKTKDRTSTDIPPQGAGSSKESLNLTIQWNYYRRYMQDNQDRWCRRSQGNNPNSCSYTLVQEHPGMAFQQISSLGFLQQGRNLP